MVSKEGGEGKRGEWRREGETRQREEGGGEEGEKGGERRVGRGEGEERGEGRGCRQSKKYKSHHMKEHGIPPN